MFIQSIPSSVSRFASDNRLADRLQNRGLTAGQAESSFLRVSLSGTARRRFAPRMIRDAARNRVYYPQLIAFLASTRVCGGVVVRVLRVPFTGTDAASGERIGRSMRRVIVDR